MTTYRITPVEHWSSKWAWWAARSNDWGGTTPTFVVAKADHYNLEAGERLCCWAQAADTDTWNDFDNVTIGASDIEFSMDTNFPAGLIYVAALPMYPFSRVQRKVNQWMRNALVSDTTSGTYGIVYTMSARDAGDGSGRTAPALPIYGFKISSGAGSKNQVVLTTYNHPSEIPGPFIMEGAVNWLLGGSTEANALLTYTNFYVYPCINPQGVWAGYFRSCPQGTTYDHNRKYYDGTSGVLEDVDGLKTVIAADVTDIDAFFDFHSWMGTMAGFGNCVDKTNADHVAYKNAMNVYDAAWYLEDSTISDGLKNWAAATYAPTLVLAPEHGVSVAEDITDYKANGENLMKALADFVADGGLPYEP